MANEDDENHWNDGLGHTVFESEKPTHSVLLGADGRPLRYAAYPIGFDLRPRIKAAKGER